MKSLELISSHTNYLNFGRHPILMIIESERGQLIRHQYGGYACYQFEMTGFVVPFFDQSPELETLLCISDSDEAKSKIAQYLEILEGDIFLLGAALCQISQGANGYPFPYWLACENND